MNDIEFLEARWKDVRREIDEVFINFGLLEMERTVLEDLLKQAYAKRLSLGNVTRRAEVVS